MAIFEIPLLPQAQTLNIKIGSAYYNLLLLWNHQTLNWNLDIMDNDGVPVLRGVPLVVNVNLLEQYGYLNFGGQLIAVNDNSSDSPVPYADLGVTSHLRFVTA
jgi:hypothetical protein